MDYFGSSDSRNSAYAFTTNHLGWVTQVDNNDSSTTGTAGVPRVVLYAKYDLNGNRTALNAQVNVGSGLKDDFQNSYTFDRLNRETSVLQQAASSSGHYGVGYKRTDLAWDDDSRLQRLDLEHRPVESDMMPDDRPSSSPVDVNPLLAQP